MGASAANGSVTGSTIMGNLANNNTAVSTTSTYTATTVGVDTISSTGSLTNHTVGGTPTGTPTGTSITVYSGAGVWGNTTGGKSWGVLNNDGTADRLGMNWLAVNGVQARLVWIRTSPAPTRPPLKHRGDQRRRHGDLGWSQPEPGGDHVR